MHTQIYDPSIPDNIPGRGWLILGAMAGCALLIGGVLTLLLSVVIFLDLDGSVEVFGHVFHHGIMWYYWAPLILLGGLVAVVCWDKHFYYYRAVPEGEIVDEYEITDFYGGRYYRVVVEGITRAGEIRQEAHPVGLKSYLKMKIGDDFK